MSKSADTLPLLTWCTLVLVLLSSPQQLLDVLGDLLSFTDDVFSAGQTGVRLTLVIIQLRYRAALSHPAAAAQTTSSAKARVVQIRFVNRVIIVTIGHTALLVKFGGLKRQERTQ